MITLRVPQRILMTLVVLVLVVSPLAAPAQDMRSGMARGPAQAVIAKHGMVVAQERLAAEIGASFLSRGGNAIDAAVATGFAMAVTYPRAGNLGGGGFMVIHSAAKNEDGAIDYRETAPQAATQDMFLTGG